MPKLLLYQSRAEPVGPPRAEQTSPDRYHQPQAEPVRGPRRLAPWLPATVGPVAPAFPEATSADRYQSPPAAPARGRRGSAFPDVIASVALVTAPAPTPGAGAYGPPFEPAPRRRPAPAAAGAADVLTTAPEATSADRYQPLPLVPARPRPRLTHPDAAAASLAAALAPPAPGADAFGPAASPVARGRRSLGTTGLADVPATAPEATSADRYLPLPELPLKSPRRPWWGWSALGGTGVITDEATDPGRYQAPAEVPARARPRPAVAPPTVREAAAPEAVSADRTQAPFERPVRAPRRPWWGLLAGLGEPALFTPPEVIQADKWSQEVQRPVRNRARTWLEWLALGGAGVVVREAVSADRFAPPPTLPPRPRPRLTPPGARAPAPAVVPTPPAAPGPDAYRAAEFPPQRRRPPAPLAPTEVSAALGLPGAPHWQVPAEVPARRRRARPAWLVWPDWLSWPGPPALLPNPRPAQGLAGARAAPAAVAGARATDTAVAGAGRDVGAVRGDPDRPTGG